MHIFTVLYIVFPQYKPNRHNLKILDNSKILHKNRTVGSCHDLLSLKNNYVILSLHNLIFNNSYILIMVNILTARSQSS